MSHSLDDWVTTATAAAECGPDVTPGRIRDWARRGLLRPVWRDTAGRPRYVLGDVLAVECDTRRNARRPRAA